MTLKKLKMVIIVNPNILNQLAIRVQTIVTMLNHNIYQLLILADK